MQKHTKVYFDFFGYDESSYIECEIDCGARAVDIHHLERRTGNKITNNYVENLVALCRDCHIKCNESSFNMYVRIKHLELVCLQIHGLIQLNKRLNGIRKGKN